MHTMYRQGQEVMTAIQSVFPAEKLNKSLAV